MTGTLRLRLIPSAILLASWIVICQSSSVSAIKYGAGLYGSCQYSTCGITITSNGSLSNNITPSSSGACTVSSDSVAVTTDDSNGYTLTLQTNSTSNSLTNGSNNITANSGNQTSPVSLGLDKWGYRVDGVGGFGSGPTTSQSNATYPITPLFAPVPSTSGTADTLANTSAAADPAVTTTVWYGVCADTNVPAGTYSGTVVYTAVTN